MPRDQHSSRKQRTWWLLAWLFLTAASFAVHSLAWAPPDRLDAGLSAASEWPGVKSASNTLDAFLGPFWIVLSETTGDWGVYNTAMSLAACGAGAGLALLVIHRALAVRRWLARRLLPGEASPIDLGRRRVLIEVPFAGAALAAGAVSGFGGCVEPFQLKVRRYQVPVADLPDSLDGLRAILIADTHLGPRVPASFLEHAIDRAISRQPDMVLLAGDYIHAGSRYIAPAAAMFKRIVDAGIPAVGVLGNHDWYNSGGLIAEHLRAIGIHMVDNARVFLDAGTRRIVSEPTGTAICIAGVGDLLCDSIDLDAALKEVPPNMPRIVLSHNPDAAERPECLGGPARSRRVDLMLSGHTHGGQISVPLVGPLYVPGEHGAKYAGGLVQGPSFPVLVSRGVGMSICPVRLGVPPELVEVTFVRA